MTEDKIEQAIEEMKKVLIFTKKLSSWHAQNLQNFGFICFENVKSIEIKYDLGLDGKPPFMYYYLTRKGRGRFYENERMLESRGESLVSSVRKILWKEMDVRVFSKKDGKLIWPREENE